MVVAESLMKFPNNNVLRKHSNKVRRVGFATFKGFPNNNVLRKLPMSGEGWSARGSEFPNNNVLRKLSHGGSN